MTKLNTEKVIIEGSSHGARGEEVKRKTIGVRS